MNVRLARDDFNAGHEGTTFYTTYLTLMSQTSLCYQRSSQLQFRRKLLYGLLFPYPPSWISAARKLLEVVPLHKRIVFLVPNERSSACANMQLLKE
jgi:hypothetical protein